MVSIEKSLEENNCGYECRKCRCPVGADMSPDAYPKNIQQQVDARICSGCAYYANLKKWEAETRCGQYLASANEAEERGDRALAEKLYAKSGYWRDRMNKLSGDA